MSDFVKPVVKAKKKLAEHEKTLADTLAKTSELEAAHESAKSHLETRLSALEEAKKEARVNSKALRQPRTLVQKIKRKRLPKMRALHKAEGRAKWAWKMVEKRRDNPRYEGTWMKTALARAATRDEKVNSAKAELDEVTRKLDAATAEYDVFKDADQKARNTVRQRSKEVREARAGVKNASKNISANKQGIKAAQKSIKKSKGAIKAAKAREKLPLRILITPRKGRERIKDTQKMLAELGYEPGVVDGVVGKITILAIKAFQREMNFKESGTVTDELIDHLYTRVGRSQSANAHMYVRQGFVDLFDAPVSIDKPAKPLGTHVYTAMHFDGVDTSTKWTAITVKNGRGRTYRKRRRGKKKRVVQSAPGVKVTAQEALDRLVIPTSVRNQVSLLLTPGSSMVISDKGMSNETGKGTDFVVLTR